MLAHARAMRGNPDAPKLPRRDLPQLRAQLDGNREDLYLRCKIFIGVIHKLSVLHAAAIVHSDVNLRNIVVWPDMTVQFIDFGQSGTIGVLSWDRAACRV